MTRLSKLTSLLAAAMLAAVAAEGHAAAPKFVPSPSAVYDGFVAINGPRADVPVGALWIDGYGPHGEAAAADNLETARGLSGITINRELELRLTAGLLDLLGIDPGLRKHFQARFADISIVRVKDVARLSSPSGEPRIVEAMKAGSITVTTNNDVGLDIDRRGFTTPFTARLDSGSKRGFTIEGRDMFIAIRVAVSRSSRSEPDLIQLRTVGEQLVGDRDGLGVVVKLQPCASDATTDCEPAFSWRLRKADQLPEPELTFSSKPKQPLPVPRADGRGGIYTSAELSLVPPCKLRRSKGCGSEWRAWLTLTGDRADDVTRPQAPRW